VRVLSAQALATWRYADEAAEIEDTLGSDSIYYLTLTIFHPVAPTLSPNHPI
jgi:hypothetical protein